VEGKFEGKLLAEHKRAGRYACHERTVAVSLGRTRSDPRR
jgi:hypothetical protein